MVDVRVCNEAEMRGRNDTWESGTGLKVSSIDGWAFLFNSRFHHSTIRDTTTRLESHVNFKSHIRVSHVSRERKKGKVVLIAGRSGRHGLPTRKRDSRHYLTDLPSTWLGRFFEWSRAFHALLDHCQSSSN